MKCLILAAGQGKRFADKGYSFPKPLLDVAGKIMLEWVYKNLPPCEEYIFVCQREHEEKYGLSKIFNIMTDGKSRIVLLDGITEGAAVSALAAKEFINNDDELLIANSDQFIEYELDNFNFMRNINLDGIIFVFNSLHPRWSYVETNDSGFIKRVAEKSVISNTSTVGLYYFKRGRQFIVNAEYMVAKNIRTHGEFYVCPVYNQLIAGNALVAPFWVSKMISMGTPEDLEYALQSGVFNV
jgi:dTDP-glucose pyrophosphorylase